MSAKLCFKLFCLTLLFILGVVQEPQAAHAAAATVTVTNPGSFKTSDRPNLSVAVAGVTGADTLTLTLSLPVPGGATLTSTGNGALGSNTFTLTANGSYEFMLAHITKPGNYTLTATLTGADTGTGISTTFAVNLGVSSKVVFGQQPTNAVAGTSLSPAVTVQIEDADNNLETSAADAVTVALGANPGGSTLGGTVTQAAVNGVATLSGLTLNKIGSGYTLTAADGALTGATSSGFNITPGSPTQLVFGQGPTNAAAGVSLSPAVTVLIEDANGNLTGATSSVTVALDNNPSSGTLGGTLTQPAVNGTATFANLSLNRPGTGYTLTASAAGLTGAASGGFNIGPGPATHFTVTAPGTASSGSPISVTVTAKDQSGNVATGYGGSLQFTSTDTAAFLPGNTVLTNGAGTFSVTLRTAASQTTITATDTVTASITGTTAPIAVSAGSAAALTFIQSPENAAVGATLSPAKVLVQDAAGNPKSGVTVSLTLAGPAATLGGTVQQTTNSSGIATFSDLTINATGTFQLVGSTPGAGGGTISGSSTIFVVTAGAAAHLAFGQQPTSAVAGSPLTPAVTVQVQDAAGNVVTTSNASVTLSIAPGANPGGGTLGGTVTQAAVNGVAAFPGLTLNKIGSGYKLAAASAVLTGAVSTAFNITPGPAGSVTLALPTPATGLTTDSTFPLAATVRDSQGNLVTDGTLVTAAISSGGGPGIVLTGGTANTVGGVATFNVSINKVGIYKFKATSGGITSAETGPLTISAGAVASLSFTRQPGATGAGLPITPAVSVLAKDASGNVVPGAAITLSLDGTSSAGTAATLNGTATQTTDSAGTAAFGDLSVTQIGPAYTLTASAGTGGSVTSSAFAVTAGPAASIVLGLSNPPAPLTTDTFFTVTATVRDAQGFPVVDGTIVSLGLTGSDGTPVTNGAVLNGGTSSTAGGVASFSININKAGSYLLTAASGTATAAAPLPVTISAGAVATLTFTQQPTSTSAGAAIAPAVTVQAKDAGGNVVPNAGISLALSGTPTTGGTAVLGGTETQATDPTGTATFPNLSISKVGTAYTLTASAGSAPSVASSSFAITPGLITLAFTAQPPASTVSGAPFAASVSLLDGSGNPVPNAPVTLTLSQGAGILAGNAAQNTDAAGHATFSGLSIDKAGADKQLTAAATVTTGTTTQTYTAMTAPAFAITPGAAATLSFLVQPPAVVTDPAASFTVTVQALDAGQNPVADSPTTTVTLSLSGSGAAALGGGITQSTVGGTATFTGLKVSAPGTYQVTAAAQTTGANTSATPAVSTSFTVGNSPGSITRLTTDVGIVHAGDPAFTLTIIGTNFVPGAVVSFSGAASVLADPKATPLVTNVSVSSDGTQVTATIAASLVTKAGNPLVTVLNPGTDPNNPGKSNFLVYPLGPVADAAGTPHTDLTAQYLNPGIQLFSVPFDYKADAAGTPLLVGDVLRAFDVSSTTLTITDTNASPTLAVWDPVLNGYLLTTGAAVPVFQPDGVTADSLVLGQGYWGRFQFHPAADPTRQAGLAVRGLDASALPDSRKLSGQTFAITLQPGWNMIGDPFTGAVNLSLIQVQPLDGTGKPAGSAISLIQASDSGFVNDFFYKYVGGTGYVPVTPAGVLLPGGAPASSDNKLNPYVGYWAFSYQACQLLVPAP